MSWLEIATPYWPLPASSALLAIALVIHTRIRGWLPEDLPGPGRKNHPRPTPMAGMMPAALTVGICFWLGWTYLASGLLLATAVGAYDDYDKEKGDGISWRIKALGMFAATILATLQLQQHHHLDASAFALISLAMFCIANAVNFLDNMNGVAVSLGCAGLCWISGLQGDYGLIALCWLGFLPFNWPGARLFLGDQGALCLGLFLAYACALRGFAAGGHGYDYALAAAPCLIPCLDFCQVILARLCLGRTPWTPDRRHLSHILHQNLGVAQVLVAPLLVGLALLGALLLERRC